MKLSIRSLTFSLLALSNFIVLKATEPTRSFQQSISFQENKGQVHDQFYKPRPDVLFSGSTNGMVFHLKNNGISYQLNRIDEIKQVNDVKTGLLRKDVVKQSIYRLDVNWLNSNSTFQLQSRKELPGYANYYTEVCSANNGKEVKSYEEVIYTNLYNGIDLKWYVKDGELKYDYLVSSGADYKQIELEIKGAQSISINSKGELVIKTPLGIITEQSPLVMQDGNILESKWVISNDHVSFKIEGINQSQSFVIDPAVRAWGTYYGSTSGDFGLSSSLDASGNVYLAGYTTSSTAMATTGAHQTTQAGSNDAYLVKLNSAGVRQWATYYGGSGDDVAYACAVDASGNVALAGRTTSSTGTVIASGTGFDLTFGGNVDGFVVKFNSSGVRQWGSYYGGNGTDIIYDCEFDGFNGIAIVGSTDTPSSVEIASAGSHQTVYGGGLTDGFVASLNSAGARSFGTYYGGNLGDIALGCITDNTGGIYVVGNSATSTGTAIASVGSYQSTYGGGSNDAFIAYIFTGARQWGTYYGGSGNDVANDLARDASFNLFVCGYSASTNGIATAGAHQTSNAGNTDAFLAKFSTTPSVNRLWGTYYGGSNNDYATDCARNSANNNIYISGYTNSIGGIATFGAWQTAIGAVASNDGFVGCFSGNTGLRIRSSYYGGSSADEAHSCSADGNGNVYLVGNSASSSGIASIGSHQSTLGGGTDAFIAKFEDCSSTFTSSISSASVCAGQTVTISTGGTGITTYSWNTGATTGTVNVNPSATTSYTLLASTATAQCVYYSVFTVSVTPGPTVSVTSNTTTICSGSTATITASGATSYTWNTSATTSSIAVSPTTTTVYTVTGSNASGCTALATRTITVNISPTVAVTASSPTICSGNTVLLTATGATSYFWSTSNSTNTITVTPNTTTTYSVTGTTAGCSNSQTISVGVTTTPTVNVSSSTSTICTGGTALLTASGASTFSWSTGSTSPGISVSPTVTTTYTVTGNNGSCSNTRTITITNNTPILNVSATSTAICSGGTSTITASGATTYSWNTGATTSAINVSPSGNTIYTVTGTTGSCSTTRTISINVSSAISMNIVPSATVSCSGSPVVLTASGASTYTWNTGSNSTTISVTPTTSTSYTVNGTSGTCLGSTVITIGASTNPNVSSITSQSIICSLPVQQSATLTASGASTYSWNTGATTAAITVSPGVTTTYTVTGFNAQGCFNTSVITQSVATCTDINESVKPSREMLVYPNPTTGSFSIRTSIGGKFEIVNQLGQIVFVFEVVEGIEENIQITSLQDGVYYLFNSNEKIHKKIVVTKE